MTLVAAASTVLAALPLWTVFAGWTWLLQAVVVVAAISLTALLARTPRAPYWLAPAAMLVAYGLVLTRLFPSGREVAWVLPSFSTLRHFSDLLATAGEEMRQVGVPVADRPGFLFLSAAGLGGVAILVDLFAVELRRPALSGLPMLAVYGVPVAAKQDSVDVLPFVLGAAGFLWLLLGENLDRVRRFGRRYTSGGPAANLGGPTALASAGRWLGVAAVAVAVTVPLVVPAGSGGLATRLGDLTGGLGGAFGGAGRGGGGSSVNLFAEFAGKLNQQYPTTMLKLTTTDPDPHYLRLATADQLTASGFGNAVPSAGRAVTAGLPAPGVGRTAGPYHTGVEVLDLDLGYLPVYQRPTSVRGVDAAWRYDPEASVVYSTRRTTRSVRAYEFDSVRPVFAPDALRSALPLARDDPMRRFATVPARIPEVDSRVALLTAGRTVPYDQVLAIFNHFSPANGYRYSTSTQPGTSGSQIVDFLRNRTGFCVQYAAAMAWLVRAAGIPARVAFGFTRGTGTYPGTTTLTSAHLHAWTEVYFAGFGWVPFDPTPASGIAGSSSPAWAPNPSRRESTSTEPVSSDPSRNATTPAVQTSAGASPAASAGPTTAPAPPRQGGSARQGWLLWALAVVVGGLVALLATPAMGRLAVRRRRLRPVGRHTDRQVARDAVHAAWDELLDTMTDYRIALDHAETPHRTAQRLASHVALDQAAASAVQTIGRAEAHARYAHEPPHCPDLHAALATVRPAIAARVPRRTRVKAAVLPPSIMRRWRTVLVHRRHQRHR